MKFKIGFVISCIMFIIIGVNGVQGDAMLTVAVLPFIWIGDGLRYLSTQGGVLNILSIVLFVVITLIPFCYLIYQVIEKKAVKYEYILLPILSIALGRTLYIFINPHLVYNSLNEILIANTPIDQVPLLELIVTSGVAYIFYVIVLIFIIYKAYHTKLVNGIDYFKVLINVIILIFAFSVLSIALSIVIQTANEMQVRADKEIIWFKFFGELVTTGLLVYLLLQFKEFVIELDKDGFQPALLKKIDVLSKLSFGLLITMLGFQLATNLFQMAALEQMNNVNFTLDIPIAEMLIVSIILIVSKYMSKVIEVKEENELFI